MIYYDVSEGRAISRLSPKVQEIGQPVVGLEPATGADILISIGDNLPGNVNRQPGKAMLSMFIENGMLVQRKTGMDFLGSIPDLMSILWRMRAVGDEQHATCWLMVCGKMDRWQYDNTTMMDGRSTGWNWNSVQGALEEWQRCGGYVSLQPDDDACAEFLLRWDKLLPALAVKEDKGFEKRLDVPKLQWDARPWRKTLMTFPGIGDVASDKIAEHTGRLCDALLWISEMDSYGVSGVGKKTRENARNYLGLEVDEHLAILKDTPSVRLLEND